MAANTARLNAVIAALEKVREHVDNLADDVEVDITTYNRWIGMLDGVVEGSWKNLMLEGDVIPATEMLMHTDAAIAFLEGCREA